MQHALLGQTEQTQASGLLWVRPPCSCSAAPTSTTLQCRVMCSAPAEEDPRSEEHETRVSAHAVKAMPEGAMT